MDKRVIFSQTLCICKRHLFFSSYNGNICKLMLSLICPMFWQFFRILQSYLEGRESEAQAMNRKTNVKANKNSKVENTGYDKYDLFLHNDIYDV